jgi:hypothetical protein
MDAESLNKFIKTSRRRDLGNLVAAAVLGTDMSRYACEYANRLYAKIRSYEPNSFKYPQ